MDFPVKGGRERRRATWAAPPASPAGRARTLSSLRPPRGPLETPESESTPPHKTPRCGNAANAVSGIRAVWDGEVDKPVSCRLYEPCVHQSGSVVAHGVGPHTRSFADVGGGGRPGVLRHVLQEAAIPPDVMDSAATMTTRSFLRRAAVTNRRPTPARGNCRSTRQRTLAIGLRRNHLSP